MDAHSKSAGYIFLKGAREHNLKNFDLRIPRGQLVVVTGVSGSGKSSLAFDTLYAEGYRKYMDSLSTKARQLLDQVTKPDIDYIEGLSPVIAIEQRTGAGANPRSTVATVTEIADYARLLWALYGSVYCPNDGGRVERRSLDDCINRIYQEPDRSRLLILAPFLTVKPSILRDELPRLRQRGFQRVRINGRISNLDEDDIIPRGVGELTVEIVIDRILLSSEQRSRLADSLELAFREGKDRAIILAQQDSSAPWHEFSISQHFACSRCGQVYDAITPRNFSYNSPDGACPQCHGIGETLQFSDQLMVPDTSKSIRNGAIKPWRLGSRRMIIRHNAILKQLAEQVPFDATIPWVEIPEVYRQLILHGGGERLFSFKLGGGNRRPEVVPFAGVIEDLNEIWRNTSSEGLRARLMTYQIRKPCGRCYGRRLKPLSLSVRLKGLNFAEFMDMTISEAHAFSEQLKAGVEDLEEAADAVPGLEQRLRFLREVGLDYLTLARTYASLSGGESQRVRLATQLGMGLVGVTYVLDEPTIGLHPVDTKRLLKTLCDLRDCGNAVIVVEHDEETVRAADHLIELGPGAGRLGGEVIFEGPPDLAPRSNRSHVGPFLDGSMEVGRNGATLLPEGGWLRVHQASHNNLQEVDVSFPVGLLTCVTGVSGSGKSSLVIDVLSRAAAFKLNRAKSIPGRHKGIDGLDHFRTVVRVDQEPIGRSPRSNPATYIKLFDLLRTLFSRSPLAKVRGYRPSRFSFNVRGGRCERCKGDGMTRLDMQFLADVYVECPSCRGRRYNRETLDIRFKGLNIAEVLDLTVDEALSLFRNQPRIVDKLKTLSAVGLGYLCLGQAANTLSGGEAQRIKLALELSKRQQGDTLYILDEPTTGLHWLDIQKLMDLLFQLRDSGNTIIVIEHHLDVIKLADWIVDLGPEGGSDGGEIIFSGLGRDLPKCLKSATARCLEEYNKRPPQVQMRTTETIPG